MRRVILGAFLDELEKIGEVPESSLLRRARPMQPHSSLGTSISPLQQMNPFGGGAAKMAPTPPPAPSAAGPQRTAGALNIKPPSPPGLPAGGPPR